MPRWILRVLSGLAVLSIAVVVGGYFFIFARPHPSDPLDSQISFDDLEAFSSAYEIASAADSMADAYEKNYFSTESDPVKIYMSQFGISAEQTAADSHERPKVYDLIVARTDDVISTEQDIRSAYAKLEERYPEAVFAPVHLLFGLFQARGLIRPFGILIGGEFFIGGDNAEDYEGWNNSGGLIVPPALLPSQVIHEVAHIQQARKSPIAYMSSGSVLNWAIYEGSADYIASSITGAHTNEIAHAYMASNENALWCAFYESRDESRQTHWIDADVFGRPPGGIAGAFGYRIVEAYYAQVQDNDKAFIDLIELADYEYVYEKSGFAARLANACD